MRDEDIATISRVLDEETRKRRRESQQEGAPRPDHGDADSLRGVTRHLDSSAATELTDTDSAGIRVTGTSVDPRAGSDPDGTVGGHAGTSQVPNRVPPSNAAPNPSSSTRGARQPRLQRSVAHMSTPASSRAQQTSSARARTTTQTGATTGSTAARGSTASHTGTPNPVSHTTHHGRTVRNGILGRTAPDPSPTDRTNPDSSDGPRFGSGMDPSGMGGDRGGYRYPPSPGEIADHYEEIMPVEGVIWYEQRVQHNTVEDQVNPLTGLIRPWVAPRPETGSRINHSTPFDVGILSRRLFLANFVGVQFARNNKIRDFTSNFPSLASDAKSHEIFNFHQRVVRYCLGYGVYVPPLQTYEAELPLGRWYEDLDEFTQNNLPFAASHLLSCLTGKQAKLSYTDSLSHLQQYTDPHDLLYDMLVIAGHPALIDGAARFVMPYQRDDTSIAKYHENWQHFLFLSYLSGVFYSDRYYTERFFSGLNNSHRQITSHMILLTRQQPLNAPLPSQYYPKNILGTLVRHAQTLGIKLDLTNASRRGRADRTPPLPDDRLVRLIDEGTADPPSDNEGGEGADTDPLDWLDDELYLAVCQATQDKRTCDLCKSEQHLIRDCPDLTRLKGDKFALQRLLRVLNSSRERPPAQSDFHKGRS